jgi:membrane protease YdiL (CAAX protease family)
MPDITLGIFDHVVLLVLVVVLPWNGRRRFGALVQAIDAGDPNVRVRSYRSAMVVQWALAAAVAVAWIVFGRSADSIGLMAHATRLAIAGYAVAALAIGGQLALTRSVFQSDQGRAKASAAVADVRAMLPHTAVELRWFTGVSITAGICEEVLYRGFLFAYLAAAMPDVPAVVVIALSGLAFGLGHLYQGVVGIVKISVLGLLFGTIYWMTGSLWAPILLHMVIDLSSGRMTWRLMNEGDIDAQTAPATP